MAEKICPILESPSNESIITCKDGSPYGRHYVCQAWSKEFGDCKLFPTTGLKVARGETVVPKEYRELWKYKEMWEKLLAEWGNSTLGSVKLLETAMDKIEAEGKSS